MLLEDFLVPLGMTQQSLAERLQVSYPRINELIHGKRGVTPDTALRLAKLFGTSPEFWLHGQTAWDLYHVMHSSKSAILEKIEPLTKTH